MARSMMSNHTDMQDKYYGHCYDIHPIESQYTKVAAFGHATSFVVCLVLALNRVNVAAVTTILFLHVGVNGHHVPCHYDFMFPRRPYHARRRSPIYFRKVTQNGNPSPIYFSLYPRKSIGPHRSTFGDGVVLILLVQHSVLCTV